MAMNKARRTANLNNILTYDTLGNSTLIANLTVEGLTGAGFVKADAAGLLSVDTAAYTVVTGATNYLTKITAPNTLGQSLVYDNGTSVLVNTAVGVPGYSHAFQVMANGAGGLVVSTTDVASAIGIVNSSSANKTWDISPYGNHLVINESGIATRMKFDAGGNITIGDITNSGHKLEVVGSFRTTGTNTLSALQGVGDRMVVANTNGVLTTQPIPTGSITGTGAAGQVNFWTGTTTVSGSNNLFWDNANGRLGINNNTPTSPLFLYTNTSSTTESNNSGFILHNNNPSQTVGNLTELFFSDAGQGTGTANGLNLLHRYSGIAGFVTTWNSQSSGGGLNLVTKATTGGALTTKLQIRPGGNVIIQDGGTFTDNGQRLQVYGDTLLRGSTSTNAASALIVQNSTAAVNIFQIRNDGRIITGDTSGNLGMAINGTNGSQSLAIGTPSGNASAAGAASVAIGKTTSSSQPAAVAIGSDITSGANSSIVIGRNMTVSGTNTIAIGRPTTGSHTFSATDSIILGTIDNQVVSNNTFLACNITNVFFGSGERSLALNGTDYTINGSGSGTGAAGNGGNIIIAGGKGVGLATPGDVIFSTGVTNTSAALQSLVNRWWVKGNTGQFANVASPNASAVMQADSTTQGFLPPRMTAAQRVAIVSPTDGLTVYQNDGTSGMYVYTNGAWANNTSGSGTAGQVTYWNSASGLTGSATLQYTPTTQLLVNNSVTTSAGNTNIKGVHVTSTLNATASGDVMTGLYLNPTFNSGAFVTSNYALYAIGDSFYDSTSLASLTVQGSNTNWAGFRIRSTATGGRSYLLAASAVSGTLGGSNFSIFDETAGQPRLTINSSGYIGLMKATAGYPLDLSNNTVAVGALSSGGNLNASASLGNGLYIGVQSTTNAIVFGMFSQQQSFIWAGWNGTTIAERMRLTQNSNLLIGGTTDGGQRLQVYGDAFIRGTGNTNATNALAVQNSDSVNIFRVRNDATLLIGSFSENPLIYSSDFTGGVSANGASLTFNLQNGAGGSGRYIFTGAAKSSTAVSGNQNLVLFLQGFAPTSGGVTYNVLDVQPTINQTGGANGVTRGVYVNPTLTAAADWRSIQWDNNTGWGLYGAGTANNYLGGSLSIGNTTVSTFGDGGITLGSTTNGKSLVITSSIPGNNGLIQFIDNLASNAFQIAASPSNVSLFGYGSRPMIFWTNSAERMRLDASGNLGIGITPTVKLHVSGDTILRGSGATSATTALTVQSSASTDLFTVRNDGFLFNRYAAQIGSGTNVANGVNALTIVGYGSYAFNFNNSTGFTFPNVELTSSYLRLGGGGEKFIGNSSFTAGADLYLHAGWYSVTASYGKVSIGTAFNSSASRTLAVFDMQTMKANISGIIEAGSVTSTNGSVILRGNYTSGYLTTLGTDASSGGPMLSYGIESAQNSTAGAFVSSSAIAIPRSAYVQNGGHIWYTAPSSSTAIGTAVVPTKHMELYNSGNLVLGGGADDAVNRLQVGGNAFIKGTGNTSATFALTVQNSDSTNMFRVRNDGLIISSTFVSGGGVYSGSVTSATNGFIACNPADSTVSPITSGFDVAVRFTDNRTPSNAGYSYWFMTMQYTNLSYTSGTGGFINVQRGFAPTSGTGIFNAMILQNVINQTGGANGVTRGLYINPTLTAAADWRSIEWSNNTGWGLYGVGTAKNYLNGTTLIGTTTDDGINKLQVAGSIASAGIMRSDAARTAATNDVSIALLGSNITTYAAGFTMGAAGYGLNAVYAQHEQRFGGNATFDAGNLNGAGLMLNRLAPTAAGTITMNQQAGRIRTMSNLHLQTQIQGNNNITVTHMSGLHIYGHYRTTGTITLTVGDYYGVLLADPNEFSTGPTITGTNWGFYQQGAAPINAFEGSMLVGTTTTDANNRLVVSGNTRVTGNMTAAQFRLSALNTAPATSTSAGTTGEIRIDADNIYVCTATNTWKRAAIATF